MCCAGGAGVREGRHLQAGQAEAGGGQGARHILCAALHRPLQEGGSSYRHIRRPSSGGESNELKFFLLIYYFIYLFIYLFYHLLFS